MTEAKEAQFRLRLIEALLHNKLPIKIIYLDEYLPARLVLKAPHHILKVEKTGVFPGWISIMYPAKN